MRPARYGRHARRPARRVPSVVALAALAALVAPLAPGAGSVAGQAAPLGTVTGTVRSAESREPLPAVTLTVSGTQLGAITGADGRFTIANVPAGTQQVVARRLGYGADSVRIAVPSGGRVTVDIGLRILAVQLNAVVAIGYGTTSRRDLTGAVSSVSSEEIRTAPVQSVDQALVGRAAGVQVMSASGQPGAGAMVRIRGGNSISAGNDPLYVVDGIPVTSSANVSNTASLEITGTSGLSPLAALNPDDIESIDVLKDASATSIYGARAANGVILITTKGGHSGQTTVQVGGYYGQQQVRHKLPLMDATEFANMVNQAYANAGQPVVYSQSQIAAFGAGTNWQDAIFRSAPVANYNAAVSGGDQNTRYYVSGNLLRSDGVVIGTNLDRGSIRMNLDQTVSSRFRLGTHLTFNREQGKIMPNGGNGQEVSSVLLNAILAPPTLPIFAGNDYFTGVNPLTGRPFSNPVATALLLTNNEQQNRVIGNGYAEFDVVPNLTLRSTLGIDYLSSRQDFYSPSNTLPGMNFGGYGSRGALETTNWQNENTLHYNRHVGGSSTLDLLGGITFERTTSDNVSGTAQGFLTDHLGVNALNTANTFVGVFTGAPQSSLLSYFARGQWNLDDRYLFTVTNRVDGSSKFGTGNQYGFFPSAAVAWRASNENFIKRLGMFDDLKFRVSDGVTGNQDIGNYASLATLGSTVYSLGGARAIGYGPNTPANPDLKWESTRQFDAGVDAAVLQSRVSVTADYYNKTTHDLLLYVPIPSSTGFSSQLQNVGSVRNKGFELALNTVNLTGRFGWTSMLNLAWNRNKVLNLGPDTLIIGPAGVGAGANQNPTVLKVGEPINSFYGWVYNGMQNGVPTYKDLDGDGDITDADRTILGNAQPNYTGGFSNRFTWGNFGLTAFLQWSVGNKIYNINRALLTAAAGNNNQLADVANAGTDGIPTPKIGNTFDSHPSTLFVENGTYLRGKNLRLDYNVPNRFLASGWLGSLNALQLYVSLQNFFTSTKYSGYDPEITEYAQSNLAQGFDFGTFPQPRQFTIGFNAGF
jgi:TonB-linked SusC/RagA family outer membrane protein